MTQSLHIEIDNTTATQVPLTAVETALKLTWDTATLRQNSNASELCLKIIDSDEMRQLNHQFRGKDYATNVLSFPSAPTPGVPDSYLGDMAICAAVVEQEATELKIDLQAHWTHLAIHGLLHLMGYDHEADLEAEEMQNVEVEILNQLGWPNPYQDN